jgi:hypothetical protein
MSGLPHGSNRGMVAPQLTQARVKINAVVDKLSIDARAESAPHRCLHPTMNLPHEHSDQQYIVFPGDIPFTMRDLQDAAGRRQTPGSRQLVASVGGGSAGGTNDDIKVPLDVTVNGFEAASVEELEAAIIPFGIAEAPGNRDNGQTPFNAQVGGSSPYTNKTGDETHAPGDYLIPTVVSPLRKGPNSRADMFSNAAISNRVGGPHQEMIFGKAQPADANGRSAPVGRVPLVLRRVQPEMLNAFSLTTFKGVIRKHGGDSPDPDMRAVTLNESSAYEAQQLQNFVECLAAARYLAKALGVDKLNPDHLKQGNEAQRRRAREASLSAITNKLAVNPKALDAIDMNAVNQCMLHNQLGTKLAFWQKCQYRVLNGAGPGEDGVLQIGGYMA